jgi:hypothetical protein
MTAQETLRHVLGVTVRIDHHFIGEPITDELDVRLDTFVLPTQVRGGSRRRHEDGTYRFINLANGPHQLQVKSTDARWMTLAALPTIVAPLAQPSPPLAIEVWPTPLQSTPLGMTSVRGKLVGTPAATIARRIEFDVDGVDSGHHTQSSSLAELLFLFPGRLELDADSLVPLSLRVIGGVVTGGEIVHGEQHISFTGAAFRVEPGRETRVRFHVT